MKCGDKGFTTVTGHPCGQTIGADTPACIWHSRTPEERTLLASKGGLKTTIKRAFPSDYAVGFPDREAVVRVVEDLAKRALTDQVDLGRIDTALRAASVALTAFGMATQEKMVDALLRLEHGGTAIVLLERMQASLSTGTRRPLPGRLVRVPTEEPSA